MVVSLALLIFVLLLIQIANINRPVWTVMAEFTGTYIVADFVMAGIFWLFEKSRINFYFSYFVFFVGIMAVSALGLFLVGVVENQIDPSLRPNVSAGFWSEILGLALLADLVRLRGETLFPRDLMRQIRRQEEIRKRRRESQPT